MKRLKLIVIVFFSALCVSGCLGFYQSKVVLTDPKDRVLPLEPGLYLAFNSLDHFVKVNRLPSELIKKITSPAERALIASKVKVPDMSDPNSGEIKQLKGCYSLEGVMLSFEKIKDQIYLIESHMSGTCLNQGDSIPENLLKIEANYLFVRLKNNHIYPILPKNTDSDEFMNGDSFNKWAISLNSIKKWKYGIKIDGDGEKAKVTLSSTRALKAYYAEIEKSEGFIDGPPMFVSAKEAMAYSDQMNLLSKLKKLKERIKAEKKAELAMQKKKEEAEKQKIEAEKNDGVIRYAFGQKLGAIKPSEYDSITYFTFTNSAEKSPYFRDYYALTTPETNQVFSIYGVSDCLNAEKCRKNAEKVMAILSAKYGPPLSHVPVKAQAWLSKQDPTDKSFLYFRRIDQKRKNRLIELICVTDAEKIKSIKLENQRNDCQLDENLFDESIAKTHEKRYMHLSKYDLYSQHPGPGGYSDYEFKIIPISIPGKKNFNKLYPAPIPGLSASYNKYYRKCGLNEKNDIFRLFIRYSDTKLENLIIEERESIKRKKKLESPKAKGL